MSDAPPPKESDRIERDVLRAVVGPLFDRSPTFRQMLERIAAMPHLRMSIRAIVAHDGRFGRSQYYVHHTWTYGILEVNLFFKEPALRMRAIAHEVAHAAEVACLPPAPSTAALDASLGARRPGRPSTATHGETPFALAAEQAILAEFQSLKASVGVLSQLAVEFGRPLCVTNPQEVPTSRDPDGPATRGEK